MLKPDELARLNWHPLRTFGRVENYAIMAEPRGGRLFYRMACGHRSLQSVTICERGCQTAPAYQQPDTRSPTLDALYKFSDRYDASRLPMSRLRGLWAHEKALGRQYGVQFIPRTIA